jgi:hypothetical protein
MKNLLLTLILLLSGSCAPHLIAPADQNSALVIGRVVINNKFPGNFYGLLPQGIIEKGLEIEVESRDGKEVLKVTTGENGYFLIPNITPNSYWVRRVSFEGTRSGARERRAHDSRRLSFTPVPGSVLYIGSLFIDVSERGLATYKETRENETAKSYFSQTFTNSPWTSRSFVTLGPSRAVTVAQEAVPEQRSETKLKSSKIEKPQWKPGNQWRYAWKRPGSSGTVTREVVREETFAGVPSYVVQVGKNENFYSKEVLGLLATMVGGKIIFKRDAPYQPLSWPLEVGKEWRNSFILERLEEKSSQKIDNRVVVSKVEAVKVPAGNYEALKIDVYDAYSGTLRTEYWYSPEVKWFVRARAYEQSGVREEELMSYKID